MIELLLAAVGSGAFWAHRNWVCPTKVPSIDDTQVGMCQLPELTMLPVKSSKRKAGITVIVYCWVVTPSWAVTEYLTGEVKSSATLERGETVAPGDTEIVGDKLVIVVPGATVAVMV